MAKGTMSTPGNHFEARRTAGMTLTELLVVLAILAFIMSVSIGVYRKVGTVYTLPATASHVTSIIRAAHNYSVSSGVPSKVFIDAGGEEHRITAFGFELVANWHFEDEAPGEDEPFEEGTVLDGAKRDRGTVEGVVFGVPGKIGQALYFEDGGAVVADDQARYGCQHGFSVDAWVLFQPGDLRPEAKYTVVWKDGSFELGATGDGALFASITGNWGNEPDPKEYEVQTRPGAIVADRWTHLRLIHDALELRIEIDGVNEDWYVLGYEEIFEEDWPALPDEIAQSSSFLSISRPDQFFMGAIDEVKYRVGREPKSYELGGDVMFLAPSKTIYFDTRGSLDPLRHSRPVIVSLTDDPVVYRESVDAGRHSVVVALPEGEAPFAGEGTENDDGGTDSAEQFGDPLAALAHYLHVEQQRKAAAEGTDEMTEETSKVEAKRLPVPASAVRQIIIDMTGTVRG